jgi:hypothetical protein
MLRILKTAKVDTKTLKTRFKNSFFPSSVERMIYYYNLTISSRSLYTYIL